MDRWIGILAGAEGGARRGGEGRFFGREPVMELMAGHTGFAVSDLARSLSFYRDILGFAVEDEAERTGQHIEEFVGIPGARLRSAVLNAGGHRLELAQYLYPQGDPIKARICDPGKAHLAFATSDIQQVYEYLLSKGVQFVSPPVRAPSGTHVVYFLDPDGIVLELHQRPT